MISTLSSALKAQLNRPDKVTDALLDSGVGLLMHSTYIGPDINTTIHNRYDSPLFA